jgi:type I restriction enzyme S subunit
VNPEDIAECEVPIPPIAEQRAIASILGSLDDDILIRQGGESGGLKRLFKHLMKRLLSGEWSVDHAKEWLRTTRPTVQAYDDKIELNRRMNQTLEEIARALFKFWFVDFGPVRAKAEGRWKKGESLPGMPADMWDLWPSEFEDSDIGEIPKGWTLGTLGDLAAWVSERVDPNHTKDKERYIALDDMPPKSIALSTFRNGSEVNSSIVRFRAGDILFGAMRPYFHKVGLAQFEGITRSTTFVLRPRGAALRPFGLFHFASADVIEFATAASVGTTIPYVHWESLAPYPVAIPSEALLQHFELGAMPILELIARNGESSRALAETRDALLPKLLSGEIRVPFGDGR